MTDRFDINIARVYDSPFADGTYRILVDRLWPRGVKKSDLHFDEWNKDLAPSTNLRKWFGHDRKRLIEFAKRYSEELSEKAEEVNRVLAIAKRVEITLLYAAKDPIVNHAYILKDLLKGKL